MRPETFFFVFLACIPEIQVVELVRGQHGLVLDQLVTLGFSAPEQPDVLAHLWADLEIHGYLKSKHVSNRSIVSPLSMVTGFTIASIEFLVGSVYAALKSPSGGGETPPEKH